MFVFFALGRNKGIEHIFLIPNDIAINKALISIPESMNSKWAEFEVSRDGLVEFFNNL